MIQAIIFTQRRNNYIDEQTIYNNKSANPCLRPLAITPQYSHHKKVQSEHNKHTKRSKYRTKQRDLERERERLRWGGNDWICSLSGDPKRRWRCCWFFAIALELAEVSLSPDELHVVVFAEEHTLMRNVVRWAYSAPSVAAFEAALVVCSPIHSNLLTQIHF